MSEEPKRARRWYHDHPGYHVLVRVASEVTRDELDEHLDQSVRVPNKYLRESEGVIDETPYFETLEPKTAAKGDRRSARDELFNRNQLDQSLRITSNDVQPKTALDVVNTPVGTTDAKQKNRQMRRDGAGTSSGRGADLAHPFDGAATEEQLTSVLVKVGASQNKPWAPSRPCGRMTGHDRGELEESRQGDAR